MKTKRSQTILCPVDFSAACDAVLSHVAESYGRDAELVVLHVGKPQGCEGGRLVKEHLHSFSRYSDLLSRYGCRVRFAIECGAPAATIVGYAASNDIDMIVLGSHGQNNIPRLLVGSTTETVMRHAPCPVIIVKTPDPHAGHRRNGNPSISALQ